jgi:dTMP kinase
MVKKTQKHAARKKGKVIVLDGVDGAGKTTQTELLISALEKQGRTVKTMRFPVYKDNFFGGLIRECLDGKHGDFIGLDPKIASVLYAADRFESAPQIREWLDRGYVVVLDRYVSSNQIHQGGKCRAPKERREFLTWIDTMEHGVFGIPRPDIIVYLSLPFVESMRLIEERTGKGGHKDLADSDPKYLEDSRKNALSIIKERNNWKMIECSRKGKLKSIPDIHEMVMKEVVAIVKK